MNFCNCLQLDNAILNQAATKYIKVTCKELTSIEVIAADFNRIRGAVAEIIQRYVFLNLKPLLHIMKTIKALDTVSVCFKEYQKENPTQLLGKYVANILLNINLEDPSLHNSRLFILTVNNLAITSCKFVTGIFRQQLFHCNAWFIFSYSNMAVALMSVYPGPTGGPQH